MTLIIDPTFLTEEVRKALKPLGTVKHVAAGVYRLEPYKPPKVPKDEAEQ